MDTSSLPFSIQMSTQNLIKNLEDRIGTEILLHESEFNQFDDIAAVSGGFDGWVPHVTVNIQRKTEFNEQGLLHELLHIKRFLEGAFIVETPEFMTGVMGSDANVRKAFANDVTNQIEHIAIFPAIAEAGFDPYADYDNWKVKQIELFNSASNAKYGGVEIAWLSIKVGVSEFLGKSEEVHARYCASIRGEVPDALTRGKEISKIIRRFGVVKQYNLRRLYESILRMAGVPKRALLLKQFNFKDKSEIIEPIP